MFQKVLVLSFLMFNSNCVVNADVEGFALPDVGDDNYIVVGGMVGESKPVHW